MSIRAIAAAGLLTLAGWIYPEATRKRSTARSMLNRAVRDRKFRWKLVRLLFKIHYAEIDREIYRQLK